MANSHERYEMLRDRERKKSVNANARQAGFPAPVEPLTCARCALSRASPVPCALPCPTPLPGWERPSNDGVAAAVCVRACVYG